MSNLKNNKILTFGIIFIAFVLIVCALLVIDNKPSGNTEGKMNVYVKVIANENVQEFNISTTRKYLGDALLDEKIISGEEGEYGIFITKAAGVEADESVEEWWCITKEGESIMEGVSQIEIADGDKYELTLKKGYDLN